jgi:hypothetical protein
MDAKIKLGAFAALSVGMGFFCWYLYGERKDSHYARKMNYKINEFVYDQMVTNDMANRAD